MRITAPRMLPATIVALAALLGMKSVGLVRAVAPAFAAMQTSPGAPGGTSGDPPAGAVTAEPGAIGAPTATSAAAAPAPAPAISPEERALLVDLRQRRDRLDARARALAARELLLAAAERRLDQRVAELKLLQGKLQALDTARRARADDAWTGLVKLYQSMKPREAAKIFDKLKMPVLLAVVDRMDARRAAAILAAMQPERAREVTDRLAALRVSRDAPPSEATATVPPPPGASGAGG